MVGLDCEWKPSFGQGGVNPVSILQMASNKGVAVFDMQGKFDVSYFIAQVDCIPQQDEAYRCSRCFKTIQS